MKVLDEIMIEQDFLSCNCTLDFDEIKYFFGDLIPLKIYNYLAINYLVLEEVPDGLNFYIQQDRRTNQFILTMNLVNSKNCFVHTFINENIGVVDSVFIKNAIEKEYSFLEFSIDDFSFKNCFEKEVYGGKINV